MGGDSCLSRDGSFRWLYVWWDEVKHWVRGTAVWCLSYHFGVRMSLVSEVFAGDGGVCGYRWLRCEAGGSFLFLREGRWVVMMWHEWEGVKAVV